MAFSLDKNLFYRSLVSTHHSLFTEASNNCWIICVPQNRKLKNVKIDSSLIQAHCLKPSPFLKDHYFPVNNSYVDDVELTSSQLIVRQVKSAVKMGVRILGAEDAYNAMSKLYRILIIDRPLTTAELNVSIDDDESEGKEVVSGADCRQYLLSLSPIIVSEIDDKICRCSPSDQMFESEIANVVQLFTSITDAAIHKFTHSCQNLDDTVVLEYATESIVLQPFHDKLLRLITRAHKTDGEEICQKCTLMNTLKLDMSSLGTEVDLDSFRPRLQVGESFAGLTDRKTPFEKMVAFGDILNMIRCDLMKCIEAAHSPFDPSPLKSLIPDDLVAAVIFTLMHSPAEQVFYHLTFVQTFGTHLPAMNELAYSLVTFEVALAYIRNYKEPKAEQKAPWTETVSSPERLPGESHPWQTSPDEQPAACGKNRSSSSFMSFRTRDPRFDKQLKELSRMVDDALFASASNPGPSADADTPAAVDEDLGAFLNALHQKKFTMNYGKLSD